MSACKKGQKEAEYVSELPLNTIPLLIMMLCLQRCKTVTIITLTTFYIITEPSQPSTKQQKCDLDVPPPPQTSNWSLCPKPSLNIGNLIFSL